MAETNDAGDRATSHSGAAHPPSMGRRHLLRGAAGAAPVMLSLTSRPVIAGMCTTTSAAASMHMSGSTSGTSCFGRTPGYWKNHSSWPSPYKSESSKNPGNTSPAYSSSGSEAQSGTQSGTQTETKTGTLFDSVFGTRGGYPGKTLLDVLNLGGGHKDELARHIVAALLNAASGATPEAVLGIPIVLKIWHSYVTFGYFSPTSGVQWNAAEITEWLKSTMPL
jgi:hypothetical protein